MASILITGASGNIGTVLTEHLKDKHDLTLVDVDFTDFPDHLKNGSRLKEIDLIDSENVTVGYHFEILGSVFTKFTA